MFVIVIYSIFYHYYVDKFYHYYVDEPNVALYLFFLLVSLSSAALLRLVCGDFFGTASLTSKPCDTLVDAIVKNKADRLVTFFSRSSPRKLNRTPGFLIRLHRATDFYHYFLMTTSEEERSYQRLCDRMPEAVVLANLDFKTLVAFFGSEDALLITKQIMGAEQ